MDSLKARGLAEAIGALRVAADRLGALGDALGAPSALTLRLRSALDQLAVGVVVDAAVARELRQMGLAEMKAGRTVLTPRGDALLQELRRREDAVLSEIASALNPDTIAALIPALGALNAELARVLTRLSLEDGQSLGQNAGANAIQL